VLTVVVAVGWVTRMIFIIIRVIISHDRRQQQGM
jgi:hypothetical protein